jgi:sulfhydrogenase subunit beta (sulfur reductase)
VDNAIQPGSTALMEATALDQLFVSLCDAGFTVIGPTVRDGAIVLAELPAASDLPFGWGVQLEPGGYRLRRRADSAAFGHSAGPQSWKRFLHPPREKLWSARLADGGFEIGADEDAAPPRLAFIGVRPCDLRAMARSVRQLRLRRLWPVHRLVPGRHRHHRRGRGPAGRGAAGSDG